MSENNFYPKAPITEALFDIQVELPEKVTISDLEKLSSEIAEKYPQRNVRNRFKGKFEFKDAQKTPVQSIDLGVDGFINWSSDKKQVVQFRLDGFTFSRLKPYEGWDKHFPEAIKNWDLYEKKLFPIRVKRIAVRFINTIEIPTKNLPLLEDYFVNFPRIPNEIAVLNSFFNRIEIFISELRAKAVITQALARESSRDTTSIILDLDVFREVSFLPDTAMISESFDDLRRIKNDIFQKSLTQKTKDLFQ